MLFFCLVFCVCFFVVFFRVVFFVVFYIVCLCFYFVGSKFFVFGGGECVFFFLEDDLK